MKQVQWLISIICLLSLTSCGAGKKTTTSTSTSVKTLPALPASQINIPIKIYMRPLLMQMDSAMSKEFTSEKWPDYYQPSCDFRYKYRFVRSPFTFNCVNNKVDIGFQGNYQIAGSKTVCAFDKQVSPWVSGSCGFGNEPLRKVDINISSVLELLPQYRIKTTTRVDRLIAKDKCVVSLLQTDMTKEIMDSIKASVDIYTIAFDQFVQSLNNHPLLLQWRTNGNRVVPVSKYGFLNLNPSMLRMGKLNYYKDTLVFSVGFNGTPQFSSDSAGIVSGKILPPFNNTESPDGIATYLNAVYDYTFLSKLLNDSLRNKPFEVEGRTFIIKNVGLNGTSDNKIQVAVSFDGYKKGTLHLSGTPLLDTAKQVLSMPDISFSVDSKDMLVNIAKGLFRKKIMKQLKDQSVLDIAALIQKHKTTIEARLNQPLTDWLATKGNFQELKLVGLLSTGKTLQVQIFIKGHISVIGLPPANKLTF